MRGLTFEELVPTAPPSPNRADVACFVGFVQRRTRVEGGVARAYPSIVPGAAASAQPAIDHVYRWLAERGWTRSAARLYGAAGGGSSAASPPASAQQRDDQAVDTLLDLPVPIDSWEVFDRLFDWQRRPLRDRVGDEAEAPTAITYLGAAVRSFFAQGGRRCYVVRVGDPWRYDAPIVDRRAALARLMPGFPGPFAGSPVDPTSWSGVGHLFGLPEVSFLCLPDLADAVAAERPPPVIPAPAPPVPELFVECSAAPPAPPRDGYSRHFGAPRADEASFATWTALVREVGDLLRRLRREVQLVAAVPLPLPGAVGTDVNAAPESFASAFVQLAWPWLKSAGSAGLPGELESPDAVLVGLLARHALERGSYRSAVGQPLHQVHDVEPRLRGSDLEQSDTRSTLIQRVSLLGRTADGIQLLSDVTTARDEAYRQASVNRLVSALVRAARRLGEDVSFEASGPKLWGSIRTAIGGLLTGLWRDGALRGKTPSEAFQVRCDPSTMSQRDLDDGRVVVEVTFTAAQAIERIRVVLALSESGTSAEVRAA